MEIKKIVVPKYKMVKTEVGYETETIYVSVNGQEFKTQDECKNYESKLVSISLGSNFVTMVTPSNQFFIRTILGGTGLITNESYFKFLSTKNPNQIKIIFDYMASVTNNKLWLYEQFISQYPEGTPVIAVQWCEDWNTDFPTYPNKVISIPEIEIETKNIIDKFYYDLGI